MLKNVSGEAISAPLMRACDHCGKEFPITDGRHWNKRFCSSRCNWRPLLAPIEVRACDQCNTIFVPTNSKQHFCSKQCRCDYHARGEKARIRARAWGIAHPGAKSARDRKIRRENGDLVRERDRVVRIKYKENIEKIKRKYFESHKEKVRESKSVWLKKNPEKRSEYKRRRRAHKANANGRHTASEFRLICKRQKNKCAHCKKKCKLTADHIVPLSRGGTDFAYNIQGLCGDCNSSKNCRIMDYAHPSLFDNPAPV